MTKFNLDEKLAKQIVQFIAKNLEYESGLLNSNPEIIMRNPYDLLKIIEEAGIKAETIDS